MASRSFHSSMEWLWNAVPCESNHGLSLVSAPCVDLKMFPNRIAKWELFWIKEVMSKLGFRPNRVFEKKRLGHRSLACSFVTGHLQAHFVFFFKHYCPKPNFEKLKLITATSFQKNIVLGLKKLKFNNSKMWQKSIRHTI